MAHAFVLISRSQNAHTLQRLVNTWEDQISRRVQEEVDETVVVVVADIVVVVVIVVVDSVAAGMEEAATATEDHDHGQDHDLLITETVIKEI